MTTTLIQYEILDGPNADRMVDAFKYAYDKNNPMKVKLTLAPCDGDLRKKIGQHEIDAQVIGLRYESGASGMFLLQIHTNIPKHGISEEGFYNANSRKGNIVIPRYTY